MRITEILSIKKPAKRLAAIQALVKSARKTYGNTDVEITIPCVNTTSGAQSVKYLTVADKAAAASKALTAIIAQINAADCDVEGVNPDYEVVSLIAVNPVLCSLDASIQSKLI